MMFGTFGAQIDSRRPMNDCLMFGTLNHVCTNEKLIQCMGDMALMPKIWENSHFCDFDDFWTFGARI